MSWETRLFTSIYYNRETFNNRSEVQKRLEETNDLIGFYENDLKSVALITEPKKFCDDDQDPLFFLQNKVSEDLEELEQLYIDRFKLGLLLENWDECHNETGLAIAPPEEIRWNTSFLDGDFVRTTEDNHIED